MKFGRPELIWSIINFLVFVAVMTKLLYRPMLNLLDERAKLVSHKYELAERDRAEAEQQRRQSETGLAEANHQAHEITVSASKRARQAEERAVTDARAAAEKVLASACEQAQQEREQAITVLRRAAGELVVTAAERALARGLDERMQHELIGEAIAAIGTDE